MKDMDAARRKRENIVARVQAIHRTIRAAETVIVGAWEDASLNDQQMRDLMGLLYGHPLLVDYNGPVMINDIEDGFIDDETGSTTLANPACKHCGARIRGKGRFWTHQDDKQHYNHYAQLHDVRQEDGEEEE